MTMSPEGITLLTELEGCKPLPYQDSAGLWSFGIGHLLTKSELASGKISLRNPGLCRYGSEPWPQTWLDDLLHQDLRTTEYGIRISVSVPLAQCQYDALCSWTYNVGVDALRMSTLLKRLNAGQYEEVPAQMRRWVYAGGRIMEGLRRRRARESALWEGSA